MIVCQRCGKENQDHYKFCLGCGAEIKAAPGKGDDSDSVGMMKTMMADAPSGGVAASRPLPGVGAPGPAPAPTQPSAASAPNGGPSGPMAAPPAGHYQPAPAAPPHASGPVHGGPMQAPVGPPPGVSAAGPSAAPQSRQCPSCAADVPPNFKFCGVCGTAIGNASAPARQETGAEHGQVARTSPDLGRASMTLIRPDGSEGGTHPLERGKNLIGRNHGGIFENDGYLSPTHAELELGPEGAVIRDLGSLNGVFARMTQEEELRPGQVIRIGQELLRFDLIEPPRLADDGTEVMGSPNPGYWGKITVVIGDGCDGSAFPLLGDGVTLGRERGDINFPDDGYVSGLHARLTARDGKVFLADMGSSNGTFVKIQGERRLPSDSYVLLGQQLFRIDY